MEQEKKQSQKILDRFRSGNLDKDEKSTVFSWLARLDLSSKTQMGTSIDDLQMRSWDALQPLLLPHQKRRLVSRLLWGGMVAACILTLTMVGIRLFRTPVTTHSTTDWIVVTTKAGETKQISLVDGTTVILNHASELKVAHTFAKGPREVWLSGQGFFDVKPAIERPFRVHAGPVNIEVLGTSFDIKAYQSDPKIAVSVVTGRVGVITPSNGQQHTTLLAKGDGLTYHMINNEINLLPVDPNRAIAWRDNRLVYHDEPLAVIAKDLERYFDIQIQFKNNALAIKKISLDVRSPQLEQVIKAITLASNCSYQLENRILKFK